MPKFHQTLKEMQVKQPFKYQIDKIEMEALSVPANTENATLDDVMSTKDEKINGDEKI